jgi:hypothetical protein
MDGEQIPILDDIVALQLKIKISSIVRVYLSDSSSKSEWLHKPNTIFGIGNGRHNWTVWIVNSYFWKYSGEWLVLSDEERFARAWQWHLDHCKPPRSREESDDIYKDVLQKFKQERDKSHSEITNKKKKKKKATNSTDDNNNSKNSSNNNKNKHRKVLEVVEYIISEYHFATFEETDEILYYNNGVYKRGGEIVIRKDIEQTFGEDASINLCREVLDHVRRLTYHKRTDFDADVNIINVKNGLHHVMQNKLTDHDPKYLSLK